MLCINADYAVGGKLSVCPSATRRYCVETVKRMINFFHHMFYHHSIVFLYQTLRQYSDWDLLNGGVKCRV